MIKKLPLFILILLFAKCGVEDFQEVALPKVTSLEVTPGPSSGYVTIIGKFSEGSSPVTKITVYERDGNWGSYYGPPPSNMFPHQVNSITGNTFSVSLYTGYNGICLMVYLEANDIGSFTRTYVYYAEQNLLEGPF
jgi:hypothetical protein